MKPERQVMWPLPASQLEPALELARSVSRADIAILLLHDETVGALFPVAANGITEAQCALVGAQRPGDGPFGTAISERRRVVVADAATRPGLLADLARTLGFRTLEVLPLRGLDDVIVGALALMYRRTRGASGRVLRLIESCAQLIVLAVIHARRAVVAERAKAKAESTGRAKVQFVAKASHELRTPLQSISGYIDLLRMGGAEPMTPAQQRLLKRVRDSEELLVHVIDDLITFSRLEAGQISYSIGTVLAADALRAAETIVAPLASERGVRLEMGDCQSSVTICADPDKVKQILVNLTANAVKFTPRDGVVTLSCRVRQTTVCFDIADTGRGIPHERLGMIFEPYAQLEAPLDDRYGGSGLGLAISREFATGMQGKLSATSTVGEGSVFTLQLPRPQAIAPRPVERSRRGGKRSPTVAHAPR